MRKISFVCAVFAASLAAPDEASFLTYVTDGLAGAVFPVDASTNAVTQNSDQST